MQTCDHIANVIFLICGTLITQTKYTQLVIIVIKHADVLFYFKGHTNDQAIFLPKKLDHCLKQGCQKTSTTKYQIEKVL